MQTFPWLPINYEADFFFVCASVCVFGVCVWREGKGGELRDSQAVKKFPVFYEAQSSLLCSEELNQINPVQAILFL